MPASEFSDVFVSYRRSNVEFVKKIVEGLQQEGKEVWIDWEDIPPGVEGFADEIKRGLEGADAFIAVLTPDYLESTYCVDMELAYAVELKKRIIPIVLTKFEGMVVPRGIGHINWIYFTEHAGQANTYEESFPKILDVLHADLDHVRQHKRYLLRALEWDENQRESSRLMDGDEITQAESWLLNSVGKDPVPTDLHKIYIESSRKLATRRQRILFSGVIVALVISVALAILSLIGFQNASLAESTAVANYAIAATAQIQAENSENFALTQKFQAEENANFALTQEAIAVRAQFESEENANFALTQKFQAEENADFALTQQAIALDNASTAVAAQFESEENANFALTQKAQAEENQYFALTQQAIALENASTAVAAQFESEQSANFALTQKAQAEENQYFALTQQAIAQSNEALAVTAQFQAEENYQAAEVAKAQAEHNLIEAWQVQARFFGDLSMQNSRLYEMVSQRAMQLGIQALLHTDSQAYSDQAYQVLDSALRQTVQALFYKSVNGQAELVDIDAAKQFVVFASSTWQVIDTTSGDLVLETDTGDPVQSVVNPADDRLAILSMKTNEAGIATYWLEVLDIAQPAILWTQEIANEIQLQWSSDSQNLVAYDQVGSAITLYEGSSGEILYRYGSGRRLLGLRLNPLQAITQNGNIIEFTDVASGEIAQSCDLEASSENISLALSRNQAYLLVKGTNRAWLCELAFERLAITWETGDVTWLADSNVLRIVDDDRIEVRDMDNKTWVELRNQDPTNEQYYMNGKSQLARIYPDPLTRGSILKIYDMRSGTETHEVPIDNRVVQARWRSDNALIMLWDTGGNLVVYDPAFHERLVEINRELGITDAGWTDDFARIYTISTIDLPDRKDSLFALYDANMGEQDVEIVHNAPITGFFVLNEHQVITSTFIEDAAQLYAELWKWETAWTSSLLADNLASSSFAWLPDTDNLLYVELKGDSNPLPLRLLMWNQVDGEMVYQRDFVDSIRIAGFAEDGNSVMLFAGLPYYPADTPSDDVQFIVLNTNNGDEKQILHTHTSLSDALVSDSGKYVLGWFNGETQAQVWLWDLQSSEVVYQAEWDGKVSMAQWSPDSSLVAVMTDNNVRIVDLETKGIISNLSFEASFKLHGWNASSTSLLVSTSSSVASSNLLLWNRNNPDNPQQITLDFTLGLAQWHGEGNALVVTGQGADANMTDVILLATNGDEVQEITIPAQVAAMAINPQGTKVAFISRIIQDSGLSYYTSNIWTIESNSLVSIGRLEGESTSPFINWNADGSKFVTKANDVLIWDEQAQVPFLKLPDRFSAGDLAWSTSGENLVTINQTRSNQYQLKTWITDYGIFLDRARAVTLRKFTVPERQRLFLPPIEESDPSEGTLAAN